MQRTVIEIPLTRGYVALIDEIDAARVLSHKWRAQPHGNTVYAVRSLNWINGKRSVVLMHRFVMDVDDPALDVDHDDGNGLDNRRHNLRPCRHRQNAWNSAMRKDNASGLKGVGYNKRINRYHARIFAGGKSVHLGSFVTPQEAHQAYCAAALTLFGEFARFG